MVRENSLLTGAGLLSLPMTPAKAISMSFPFHPLRMRKNGLFPQVGRDTAPAARRQRVVLHFAGLENDGGGCGHSTNFPLRHSARSVRHGDGGYGHPQRAHELGHCSRRQAIPDHHRQNPGNLLPQRDSELEAAIKNTAANPFEESSKVRVGHHPPGARKQRSRNLEG